MPPAASPPTLRQRLSPIAEVRERIVAGQTLLLAGDERLLAQLPRGDWIGGTTPYVMPADGGGYTQEQVFVTEPPEYATRVEIADYDVESLPMVYRDLPDNGFGVVLLPGYSETHLSFALEAPTYEGFAMKPLIGWVAGVALDDIGEVAPKVFDGRTGAAHENAGLVMQVTLPSIKTAEIGIVNLFAPGDGDTIAFLESGFEAADVLVNGERRNLAEYAAHRGWDTGRPLVATRRGAGANVGIESIDELHGVVRFFAPVFTGVEYRHAVPVSDDSHEFEEGMSRSPLGEVVFSCNSVLNDVHTEPEGHRTGDSHGPFTFGEVAYQLQNQTMVYLTVTDLSDYA